VGLFLMGVCGLLACAGPPRSRAWLEEEVKARTHFALGTGLADGGIAPGLSLDDGLSADEAVAVALWRSPALHAELTQLDAALASLDEANRPANPRLNNFLFPLDFRQLAVVLFIPLESLWQMPSRISAATYELQATAESLVQLVLDTQRTVRLAHTEVVLLEARVGVLQQAAEAWSDAVALADARASAGDIAPVDADQIRVEQALAEDLSQRAQHDVVMARERLSTLLGAPWERMPAVLSTHTPEPVGPLTSLQQQALERRPELAAAAFSVNAAAARADWERSRVFSIFLSIDGQAPVGSLVPSVAPGVQAELPIFSQNQGGIGRADAAVTRASHRYLATRLNVLQDVALAHAVLERASISLVAARRIVGLVESTRAASVRAFESGSESYLVVIDAVRRATDAKLRVLEVEAELRRADAELIRAIGGVPHEK